MLRENSVKDKTRSVQKDNAGRFPGEKERQSTRRSTSFEGIAGRRTRPTAEGHREGGRGALQQKDLVSIRWAEQDANANRARKGDSHKERGA